MLNFTPISRIRRNHALEHATLQILSRQYPERQMAGHSDLHGCRIVGNVPGEDVQKAAFESRCDGCVRERPAWQCIPNCGTNYAVGGSLAGMAGALAMLGAGKRLRDKLERLSVAAVFGTVALILAQPLSYRLQSKITTASDPLNLEIVQVVTVPSARKS